MKSPNRYVLATKFLKISRCGPFRTRLWSRRCGTSGFGAQGTSTWKAGLSGGMQLSTGLLNHPTRMYWAVRGGPHHPGAYYHPVNEMCVKPGFQNKEG